MNGSNSERIIYFDVVKFLAICLVCIGHSYYMLDMAQSSSLKRWIYSFHMPLFMLLCGYFSSRSYEKPFIIFLKQKAIQLLLPAITISLLTILVCYFIGAPNIEMIAKAEIIGGMWFLRTLFFCFICTYIVRRLYHNDFIIAIGSIIVALILPHGYFLQFNWMLIFFWAGYFFKYYNKFYIKFLSIITVIALFIFVIFCVHKEPKVLTYHVFFHTPWQLPLQLITGLSGSLSLIGCTYYFCKWLGEDSWIVQNVAKIGTYTLGIYGLQSIIPQRLFVNYLHFDLTSLPVWISDLLIVSGIGSFSVFVCYCFILLLRKNKILNLLMFGNQY